ncbi:MAG: PD-(D/E)XK nuclease family protein [bacterium]|nr:PD-(D/E)XK nuclease family protein [bacterium]
MPAEPVRISAKNLAAALPGECPRCFWITRHCDLPYQMPFPGVFNVIDAHVKATVHAHFNRHGRLPEWYPDIGRVTDYVRDAGLLHPTRFRVTDAHAGVTLTGAPDDVFKMRDGSYHIVDYKVARLTARQDELMSVYEVQLNGYAYIAERVGFDPVSVLSLIYLDPGAAPQPRAGKRLGLGFAATRRAVKLRPGRLIPPLLRTTGKILSRSTPPRGDASCEDCTFLRNLIRTVG